MATTTSQQAAQDEPSPQSDWRHDRPDSGERSVGSLISDLGRELFELVRKETELAKVETSEKFSQVLSGLNAMIIAAVILLAGILVLLDAAVYGLSVLLPPAMTPWLAALIVGGIVALIGVVLVMKGYSNLKARNLALERTTETFRRDKAFVKEQTQ